MTLNMMNGISKVLTRERIFCFQTDQDQVSSLWKNRYPDMVKNNGTAIKANLLMNVPITEKMTHPKG